MPAERVAIVYDCLFPLSTGGGERVYRELAEEFVRAGAEVEYVTRLQWSPASPPVAPFEVSAVLDAPIHDAAGGRRTDTAVRFAIAVFRHLRRSRGRFDVVVVSTLPVLNVFAARLALLGTRTRLVADWLEVWPRRKWVEYSGPVTGTIAAVLQWIGARLCGLSTVNSEFTARRLRAVRPGAAIRVLGLASLAGDPAWAPTATPGGLLFVGRHIADKRVDLLPGVLAAGDDTWTMVVGGAGPETPSVEAEAARLGVAARMTFTGRVDEETLDRLYREAAVLVLPSAREGFGLVVAESAARGTPVVVVDSADNAAADLVLDGVNGFRASRPEAAAIAEAVRRCIDGGEALRRRTRAWYDDVAGGHSLATDARALLEHAG